MKKKQLNLSAPLLSARRYSSPLRSSGEELKKNSLPANKADINLEEVAKPGSVPFNWEQTPGRAKTGSHSQAHSPEEPANAPRLPPGGFPRPQNKLSGEQNVVRQPTKFLSGELAAVRAQNGFSLAKSVQLYEDVNQRVIDSGSDSDDAAFSDALDAVESYSMNCSTSGLSASELSTTNPSGNSYENVGNRDFMMNRFLPAAKAMTLESPQYALKRQIVAIEQPHLSKVIVPKIVKGPSHALEKNVGITLYKGQDIELEQSEDDEEERSCEPRNISVKSCGFFPWFCSNNGLRILNPVPVMKVKTKSALASASKVGRLVKNTSYKSPTRTNSKHMPSIHKRKLDPMTKSCELNRIESKPKSKSRPMFLSGELVTRNGDLQARNSLSPYRNYKRRSVSPYRNEARATNISGPMSFHQSKMQGSGPGSPVTEKTLYVDSLNIIRSRESSGRMDHNLSKMNRSFRSSKVLGNGHVNSGREIVLRTEDPATQSPLPPPLPKSPSESWLSRNLNAASPRNSVSRSHAQTPAITNTKWETIVKSSHLRCDYGLHSEELVARAPQQSRTRK